MTDYVNILQLTLDFVGVGMLIAFLTIGVRVLGILKKHKEMNSVRFLWQPIIVGGFFLCSWAVSDIIADIFGLPELMRDMTLSSSLIAGAASFIVALSRLYGIWSDYDRKLKAPPLKLEEVVDRL